MNTDLLCCFKPFIMLFIFLAGLIVRLFRSSQRVRNLRVAYLQSQIRERSINRRHVYTNQTSYQHIPAQSQASPSSVRICGAKFMESFLENQNSALFITKSRTWLESCASCSSSPKRACNQREIYQLPACIYNIGMRSINHVPPQAQTSQPTASERRLLAALQRSRQPAALRNFLEAADSSFLEQNSSFLVHSSSALVQSSSFLL